MCVQLLLYPLPVPICLLCCFSLSSDFLLSTQSFHFCFISLKEFKSSCSLVLMPCMDYMSSSFVWFFFKLELPKCISYGSFPLLSVESSLRYPFSGFNQPSGMVDKRPPLLLCMLYIPGGGFPLAEGGHSPDSGNGITSGIGAASVFSRGFILRKIPVSSFDTRSLMQERILDVPIFYIVP